jgi:hypothetical protein
MKKQYLIFCFTLAVAMNLVSNAAAQTLTLNLQADTFTYVSPCDYCEGGKFWTETYGNTTGFNSSGFHFSHNSGFDIYSYWGGFTPAWGADTRSYTVNSYNSDTVCYCQAADAPCDLTDLSGSNAWVHNQWGCMAGYGLDSVSIDSAYEKSNCAPYLVAYWDYYSETKGEYSLEITLQNTRTPAFYPQEVFISNHPWPYHGNICGDGFAHPFNKQGDHFYLWIHGIAADGTGNEDSIKVKLAVYDSTGLHQINKWQQVDLTSLSEGIGDVQSLYFTMESTDNYPPYGPNTAVYFCLDKLKVIVADSKKQPAVKKNKTKFAKPAIEVNDYLPVTAHTGGNVIVYDSANKEVINTAVGAGESKVDLSKLPAGKYRVRVGHKSIPVVKL